MASEMLGPLSPAAQHFIDHHTEFDFDGSSLEECPICLDAYASTSELRIRVSGVPGCAHIFGLNCLKHMLCSEPHLEKKCPLCRTQWLTGDLRSHRVHAAVRARTQLEADERAVARDAEIAAAFAGPREGADATNPASAIAQIPSFILRDSTLEETADDAAYRVQLNDYNNFRRDVQNVRNRAHGIQSRLSRSTTRSREVGSLLLNTFRASNQTGRNRTAAARSNATPGRSFWEIARIEISRSTPVEQQARPHANGPTTRRASAASVTEPTRALNSLAPSPTPPTLHPQSSRPWTPVTHSPNPPSSTSPTQPYNNQQPTELRQNEVRARIGRTYVTRPYQLDNNGQVIEELSTDDEECTPPSSHGHCLQNEYNIRKRIAELNKREANITSREQLISVREREVFAREQQVSERENSVLLREQRMRIQQQRLDGVTTLVVGHADEVRAMLGRQQEDITRAFGEGGRL